MKFNAFAVTALALAVAASILFGADLAHAGFADPLVRKGEDLTKQILTIGKVGVGIAAAVLLCLAAAGKIAWHWLGMVIVAGAGMQGYDSIRNWLST